MPLGCDMIFEKGEKKKFVKRRDRTTGRSHQKDNDTDLPSAPLKLMFKLTLLFFWFCTPWLTDVSSSQRWVIYSQTNSVVSNYTYLFRFVWFVVVFWLVVLFSNLSLCFLACYNVFGIMFSELLFCFLDLHLLFCFQNRDLFCTSQPP